jgi:serine/threonine-protein kinase HipA
MSLIHGRHSPGVIEKQDEAEKIVSDMKGQVDATWYDTVRACGVSEKDAETIRGAFVYPEFSL